MSAPYRHPLRWLADLWQSIHKEYVDPEARWDYRAPVMLITCAVSLAFQEFIGDRGWFYRHFDWFVTPKERYGELWSFVWWSGWRVLGFLILPSIVVLCMPGERLRDYFWSPRGFVRKIGLYVVMYLIVLPFMLWLAGSKDFQRIYPFYKHANCSTFDFVAWQLLYAAQFLSLEFFFRGFMLFAARRVLGVHAIWVMVVPYAMIHFGKTLIETLAAVIAGVTLGTIAMKTKSIWGGIFVHVAVAVTMDSLTVEYLHQCRF